MKFFLCVIGMVMIIEGLPWFASPDKMKNLLTMLSEQPDRSLRILGFVMMLLGLGLIWFGKI
jgi:uncharacterized protein YjeT (DUF2065 family)